MIKILKNGDIILENVLDNGKVIQSKINDLKECLFYEIDFEDGLTFETFFKHILKEKDFFNIAFKREMNGKKLEFFEDLMSKNKKQKSKIKDEVTIEYFQVCKILDVSFFSENDGSINITPVFLGVGQTKEKADIIFPCNLCSFYDILKCKIYVNDTIELKNSNLHIDNDDSVSTMYTSISVYDAIQSIIYELCFFKTNEERKKGVDMAFKNDDTLKEKMFFLEDKIKKCVENEEYEEASILKKSLDKINLKQSNKRNKT